MYITDTTAHISRMAIRALLSLHSLSDLDVDSATQALLELELSKYPINFVCPKCSEHLQVTDKVANV